MTASNRVWNRIVLAIAGVVLLAIGAAAIVVGLPGASRPLWVEGVIDAPVRLWNETAEWTVEISGGTVPVVALIAAAVMIVVLVLLIVFVSTRGGGRVRDVVTKDGERGLTTVDRNVVEAILARPLTRRADVVSAHADTYLVRRNRTIQLAVRVQPNAALDAVIDAAESAVSQWDAISGTTVPVVVRISDRSWRDALRPTTRVH